MSCPDGAQLVKQFRSLSKREQDILGRNFGVFGYTKAELGEKCLDSAAWKLRRASRMVDRAISLEQ